MTKPASSSERILAVDTTLGACSVAVRAGSARLARRFEAMERGHAEAIAPMVEGAMRDAGLAFSDLDRLGVSTGPGTFTGQRVGVAFMRGLRIALKRPLLGVTSLFAMAHQAMEETACSLAATVHDARHGEVYLEIAGEGVSVPACLLDFEAALKSVTALGRGLPMALAGTAAPRFHERLVAEGLARVTLTGIVAPDADWVARLCAEATPDNEVPRPLYLREPDAKLPGPRS